METLAYLYAIEESVALAGVSPLADDNSTFFWSGSLEDDQFELLDDEVDELEQSGVWMMM